ncbi:MAG: hypothetical protein Q7T32_06240 [Moraxellaceae bacterium]|nr:hypothetical protein [Moraxellaceae bacterium]
MLVELKDARQIHGEPIRRWFMSPAMDLIIWHDEGMCPIGFQLCYDKGLREKAITWHRDGELAHSAIHAGEDTGLKHKEAPILVDDGNPDFAYITKHFEQQSGKLPPEVARLVLSVLNTQG